jgi:hypothetical protein
VHRIKLEMVEQVRDIAEVAFQRAAGKGIEVDGR